MQLYFDGLVDERRQSTVAVSIRELRDTIAQQLGEKFPDEEKDIPSLEWIRYQFWPRNPYCSSALRHYTTLADLLLNLAYKSDRCAKITSMPTISTPCFSMSRYFVYNYVTIPRTLQLMIKQ
jgi:hypothetical protein